jgi:hypothetical protein
MESQPVMKNKFTTCVIMFIKDYCISWRSGGRLGVWEKGWLKHTGLIFSEVWAACDGLWASIYVGSGSNFLS